MHDCVRTEPTIDEIMADPTVRALMKADRVNIECLYIRLQNAPATGAVDLFSRRPVRTTGAPMSPTTKPLQDPAWS